MQGQLQSAWPLLEDELLSAPAPAAAGGQPIGQAGLSLAGAWYFAQALLPGAVPASQFPVSAALSAQAEALAAFAAWPHH